MKTKDILLSFILGSTIISTFISFSYIGKYFNQANRPSNIPYELFPLFIPFMFGLFNILNVYVHTKYKVKYSSFLIGGIMGVVFSIFGRFLLDLPITIFNYTENNQWMVHPIAFFLYGSIFQLIINKLNKMFSLII